MDKKTADRLKALNHKFYQKTQVYFNRSRQHFWVGWEKLLPYLQGSTLKVLDLGCGNGRFGKWLMERGKTIDYTGIDENQFLLKQAKTDLPQVKPALQLSR